MIATTDNDGSPGVGGGLGKREEADQKIVNYIGVSSIDTTLKEVVRLGGKILVPKTAVGEFGYMELCEDTEGNTFGLWEENPEAE